MPNLTWTDDMGDVSETPEYEAITRRRVEFACEFWMRLDAAAEKPAFSGGTFVVAKNDAALKLLAELVPGLDGIPGIERERILATAVYSAAHFAHDEAFAKREIAVAFANLARLTNAASKVRRAVGSR